MEILHRGIAPSERTYTTTCRSCKSKLRFKHSEAEVLRDPRDGDALLVSCPVCSGQVIVVAASYDR